MPHPLKKCKDNNGKAVIIRKGMDSFVDCALTKQEQDKANTCLIKYLPAEEGYAYQEDLKQLENKENLTYLMGGWEDSSQCSVYGCLLAEVGEFSFMIGLKELTGVQATADNLLAVANEALERRSVNAKAIVAVCTNNPTTMQAFCCKWTVDRNFTWILPLPCFMHGINTVIGKILNFPPIKQLIAKNVKIIRLKKNVETQFYAVILQAISIQEHKQILFKICSQNDAQCSICGLSPIKRDVIESKTVTYYFHVMNTDLHWLALFLHPLCCKLAVSSLVHSRMVKDAFSLALDIARKWEWLKAEAEQLVKDIVLYANEEKPFASRLADAKKWWEQIVGYHLLKGLALKLGAIVPHAVEVECFFSNLGGVQSLYEQAVKEGKQTQHQHGHMHSSSEKGINTDCASALIDHFSIPTPLTVGPEDAELEDLGDFTMEDIEAEFEALEQTGFTIAVPLEQVYNIYLT
ncbi:hypothetical protein BDQ17DRAFT_1391105 [Cyathus striatus]|nr:hypothetical protein BDQ17DRAFT_1391105 [Cyathus striatus]